MAKIDDVREICERVMGWLPAGENREAYTFTDQQGRAKWVPKNGKCGRDWDPFTDANHALKVVEAMFARFEYWTRTERTRDGWYVSMVRVGQGNCWKSCLSTTFCESVCQAALAAVRSEK